MNSNLKESNQAKKHRVVIIEDHPIFREGFKHLIEMEDNLMVCGEADSIGTALNQIRDLKPDLAVVDIGLKGRSGLDLIHELKTLKPDLLILVVSMFDETTYVQRALQAGARGYVVKNESTQTVVSAIQATLNGEMVISEPHHTHLLESQFSSSVNDPTNNPQAVLTNRELEILRAIGQGKSTREIARELRLSIKTVGTYRERIKEKMKLKHAAELARHAVRYVERQRYEE